MADREKVIAALELCVSQGACYACPYIDDNDCAISSRKDAIELLKEQKTGHWTTKRTQEHDGEWYCDQCGHEPTVFENTPYCPSCGARMVQHVWNKAVKLDG